MSFGWIALPGDMRSPQVASPTWRLRGSPTVHDLILKRVTKGRDFYSRAQSTNLKAEWSFSYWYISVLYAVSPAAAAGGTHATIWIPIAQWTVQVGEGVGV